MTKRLLTLSLCLLIAACSSSTKIAGPREFSVKTDAQPASSALPSKLAGLVNETGQSYVTLVVNQKSLTGRNPLDKLNGNVTSGSGFVIDQRGNILTAGHVGLIRGNTVNVRDPSGKRQKGTVVSLNPTNDLAMVRASFVNGTPVRPAASSCLRPGDAVFSLGKPHAQSDTARLGTIDSISYGQPVRYDGPDGFGYQDALVLRMSTRKGESGGPLFNDSGELIGMIVSTLSDGAGRPANLAHAIHGPTVAKFVCAKTNCSPAWQQLAAQRPADCGGFTGG